MLPWDPLDPPWNPVAAKRCLGHLPPVQSRPWRPNSSTNLWWPRLSSRCCIATGCCVTCCDSSRQILPITTRGWRPSSIRGERPLCGPSWTREQATNAITGERHVLTQGWVVLRVVMFSVLYFRMMLFMLLANIYAMWSFLEQLYPNSTRLRKMVMRYNFIGGPS